MTYITIVSPGVIRPGDVLNLGKGKTRKVKRVEHCQSKPMHVHLDHECYDVRFSNVERIDE